MLIHKNKNEFAYQQAMPIAMGSRVALFFS